MREITPEEKALEKYPENIYITKDTGENVDFNKYIRAIYLEGLIDGVEEYKNELEKRFGAIAVRYFGKPRGRSALESIDITREVFKLINSKDK